ncbi:thioredoxin domain-containing protein 17 isoform X1 [Anser cygnoides]|uniref:thioredoxin domain-containing protein 17 isoform X1 n=1 Tax=Anser cygnoides TaxID=8845 RepID=UPI0034D28963
MGWEEKQVRGYGEFVQTAQRYHGRPIFALFCGDKDAEGRSWCPDCVTAEPVVRKELHNMPDESVFIYCLVGDRAYWKDPNNEFRKNLKLTGVPTLLKYGTLLFLHTSILVSKKRCQESPLRTPGTMITSNKDVNSCLKQEFLTSIETGGENQRQNVKNGGMPTDPLFSEGKGKSKEHDLFVQGKFKQVKRE